MMTTRSNLRLRTTRSGSEVSQLSSRRHPDVDYHCLIGSRGYGHDRHARSRLASDIAKMVGVSRATVYRYLADEAA